MFNIRKKLSAAALRSEERRQRENDAPRLRDAVPGLTSLQISIVEEFGTGSTAHRKHVMVHTAPALFVITCGDVRCVDGGHDITGELLRSLRSRKTRSEGEHVCEGQTASAPCTRRIHYEACAEYVPQ